MKQLQPPQFKAKWEFRFVVFSNERWKCFFYVIVSILIKLFCQAYFKTKHSRPLLPFMAHLWHIVPFDSELLSVCCSSTGTVASLSSPDVGDWPGFMADGFFCVLCERTPSSTPSKNIICNHSLEPPVPLNRWRLGTRKWKHMIWPAWDPVLRIALRSNHLVITFRKL